jgi:two-component system cell cycle sensor histidine kinase/response regulator CckA
MATKPTYEELEQKVSELQKEVIKLKQVEKALKESERMLNETQRLTKVGGWEYHVGEKRTKWTDELYRINGVSREDHNPKNLKQDLSFYAPEDREKIDRAFQAAVDKGEAYDLELRFISAKGEHLWVRTIGTPVLENGQVKKVVGNLMDITERRRAEEVLWAERLKFERYFENIPLMAYNISFDGRIADCNTVVVKTLGYDNKAELQGEPAISTLYAPESQEKAKQIFEKWKKGKRIKNEELKVMTKQRNVIDVLLNVDTVLDQEGTPIHSISTHLDITERKRAYEESQRLQLQLRQAQKMETITTLTSGIAHDYNNLLSVIIGNLFMAIEQAEPGSDQTDFLNEANIASLKIRDLTHELMALSKGGAPVKRMGSLRELLCEASEAIPADSEVSYSTSISQDLWPVFYDPIKIGAVFINVINNAVEAMPDGGVLSIKAENLRFEDADRSPGLLLKPGEYVHISIQDQGVGIPVENLDKVFDPYFSTKAMGVQKGVGLGLAKAYANVQKHWGHMAIDSTPGAGTTVNIYLPAEPAEGEGQSAEGAEPAIPSSIQRILVMDDEEMLRTLSRQMLKRLGYAAKIVKNGVEAIEAYKKQKAAGEPFDMVILDLTIKGGMGGEQTIRELLKIDPHVKAIVSSGYFNDPVITDFSAYGFRGTITKPYQEEDLKETLERILKNR